MVKVSLRGDVHEFENGVTPYQIAQSISSGLARVACAAKINGEDAAVNTDGAGNIQVRHKSCCSDGKNSTGSDTGCGSIPTAAAERNDFLSVLLFFLTAILFNVI